jgi:autotransporter strand-loop-strand O-heptosyltransferase
MIYSNIKNNENIIVPRKPSVSINYIEGPRVEINNGGDERFKVVFYDGDTRDVIHSGEIPTNHWIKANRRYFVNWLITINGEEFRLNFEDKRVYISLESKSLGDTLAWIPYVEEFRKKHNCHVVCSTFMNQMFKTTYPEIEFVSPGTTVNNIIAMYNIGWFYKENEIDLNRNPSDFKAAPLQKTAADILGLDYQEIVPRLDLPERNVKKQVCLAIHSTCQAKYWNNPTGWQEVVDHLNSEGYDVILLSKEGDGYMGNPHPKGIKQHPSGPIEDVIKTLRESEFFIGIGSGLSWLSWACEIPTVIVSGFSEPYSEPTTNVIRIDAPQGACRGCFNRKLLDAGDWMWCPDHKNTPRQFECTKLITGQMVISHLKNKFG